MTTTETPETVLAPTPWRPRREVFDELNTYLGYVGSYATRLHSDGLPLDASPSLAADMVRCAQLDAAFDAHPATAQYIRDHLLTEAGAS